MSSAQGYSKDNLIYPNVLCTSNTSLFLAWNLAFESIKCVLMYISVLENGRSNEQRTRYKVQTPCTHRGHFSFSFGTVFWRSQPWFLWPFGGTCMTLCISWHKMMLARALVEDRAKPIGSDFSLPHRSCSLHISQHNFNFKKEDKNERLQQ